MIYPELFVKTCSASDWYGGDEGGDVRRIKIASSGLRGQDRKDLAGFAPPEFIEALSHIPLLPGDVPTHQIALGATEKWGANRNGDGFKRAHCVKCHHTFVKHAKLFREHNNRPTSPYYGVVKLSYYCPAMDRIHLLGILNGTKEAADRNGGLVADAELEDLEKYGYYPTSMACRLPFDVCSWCEKQAKNRREYCTETTCKAGGCRDNLGKIVKVAGDYHHLHVDNPNPEWFDNSKVWRGADPTAFGSSAAWIASAMQKAASLAASDSAEQALKLAKFYVDASRSPPAEIAELAPAFDPRLYVDSRSDFGVVGTTPFRRKAAAFAAKGAVLPFREFCRMNGGAEQSWPDALVKLSSAMSSPDFSERLFSSPWFVAGAEKTSADMQAVESLAEKHSLDKTLTYKRLLSARARGYDATKEASSSPASLKTAVDYLAHVASNLTAQCDQNSKIMLTAAFSVAQNL